MAKNEARGTKRVCTGCDAKFYDLNKEDIVCPLCGTIYETEALISKKEAEAEAAASDEEDDTADEGVDLVSLDELEKEEDDETLIEDEEAIADLDDDADADVDVSDDDDTFLEDDDDDGTDVTKLVGGGKGGGADD